ncbi:MAG TPA: hypothetical protein VF311_00765 [Terriglobales bacterium]
MITLEERIARTQRLLRRLEEDQPYLHVRLSALGAEHRQSANAFADRVRAEAEAELERLLAGPTSGTCPSPPTESRSFEPRAASKPQLLFARSS